MRNVSVKFAEKMKIHILYPKIFFKNPAVYKIMWTNRYCRIRQPTVDNTMGAYTLHDG